MPLRLMAKFGANVDAGVKSYNVSLEKQEAQVVTEDGVDYATVLEKIKRTGKTVNSGQADGVPQSV